MRAMWQHEQPLPVQGGGANAGVPGVCGGGGGRVAGGGSGVLLSPLKGSQNHGSSRYSHISFSHQCHPHLSSNYMLINFPMIIMLYIYICCKFFLLISDLELRTNVYYA